MVTGGPFSKPGDPDMVVCYRGVYLAIEAKTPTGRLREDQKIRQKEIEAAGGIYLVARYVEDVEDALRRIRGHEDDEER